MPKMTILDVSPHLQPYQVSPASYLAINKSNSIPVSHLIASAVVIHSNRVLLLQRSAQAFQPLLWELPGGKCSSDDASIIAAATRELWEESGLVASEVVDHVGTYEWLDNGEVWKKIALLIDVHMEPVDRRNTSGMPQVSISPREHAGFVWASQKDVIANECGGLA
jgi:8-oxo-dGTP pyrophosphatase MutT (NUDIX family)